MNNNEAVLQTDLMSVSLLCIRRALRGAVALLRAMGLRERVNLARLRVHQPGRLSHGSLVKAWESKIQGVRLTPIKVLLQNGKVRYAAIVERLLSRRL